MKRTSNHPRCHYCGKYYPFGIRVREQGALVNCCSLCSRERWYWHIVGQPERAGEPVPAA